VGPELTASGAAQPSVAIPDNNATGVSSSISLSNTGIGHVEVVEAEVTITHAHSGELEVTLSNGTTQSVLHPRHDCLDPDTMSTQCADIDAYVFTSVRHLDEPADGTWTLTVKDRKTGVTGTFNGWKLRVFGRQ
jgi:subtilisin-like proprotein convertase family protein